MNNHHSADECRNLTTAQDVVTQAKSKYSGDQQQSNNHANFGNLQRSILSWTNPLNQALTIQRSGHRGVIQREWLSVGDKADDAENSSEIIKIIYKKS